MASINKRLGGVWRARYRGPDGRERARQFDRKVDAQRWLDEQMASIITGQYVDPRAGSVTFRESAERWRVAQVHRPTTRAHVETRPRRHAYPALGDRPLSSVRPSDVQAWTAGLTAALAPRTVGTVHGIVSGILRTAGRDRLIVSNPCEGTRLPKVSKARVEP